MAAPVSIIRLVRNAPAAAPVSPVSIIRLSAGVRRNRFIAASTIIPPNKAYGPREFPDGCSNVGAGIALMLASPFIIAFAVAVGAVAFTIRNKIALEKGNV